MNNNALRTPPDSQPPSQHGMNGYVLPQSPHSHRDPSHVSQAQYQQQQLSEVPISSYPDFSLPYQNSVGGHVQGFESPLVGRINSPPERKRTLDQRNHDSNPGMSERRRSVASAGTHQPSRSDTGKGSCPQRNDSVDGSEATSPSSSRRQGVRGSDESTPQTQNADSKDGISGTPKSHAMKEEPPPWSELKTKAGKERKRLPLACIACRRKKIRCSGEKPACKHCLRSRIPCVYKVTTRKAAPRTDYMAMLDKRLKRMEDRVIKIIPEQDAGKLAQIGRATVKPSLAPPQKSLSTKKRPADEAFENELEEWVQPGGSRPAAHSRHPSRSDQSENRLLVEGAESLPSTEIQEHLSEVFFDSLYGQTYHLLHKPSFMRRLRAGTVPPVLILAVCAVAARFSTHPQVSGEPAFLRGESWAQPARDIALRRYDEPNITILTALLLLGLHEFGTCHGGRSWMLGGMALRMAYALQLHKELDHDPLARKQDKHEELSFTDREIRRRTMWACFLMDRFNSSGTERPPFAMEEVIEVQLPIKESHFQMEIPGPTETLDGSVPNPVAPDAGQVSDPKANMGVAAYLIRIIAIWGRVVKYLNLGGKLKDSRCLSDPDSQWTKLKKQVEKYQESLPERLKYNSENLQTHAAEKLANQFLFLHVIYNQVLLFLHKFAIPASPGGILPADLSKEFISDAAQTAVEAASQISSLLSETKNHLVAAPFVGYCAFVSSTVHIWGIFSKNAQLEATSKRNLGYNVKYLGLMKKYWGMFHYMAENLKEIYRQHADAALKGPSTAGSGKRDEMIFQYGDWFNKYPHGVSGPYYEDPATEVKKESGNDAALSQKSDLQSVEEFFTTLVRSPPTRTATEQQRKVSKRRTTNQEQAQQQAQNIITIKSESPVSCARIPLRSQNQNPMLNMPLHIQTNQHHPIDSSAYSQAMYTPTHPPLPQSYPATFLPHQNPSALMHGQLLYDPATYGPSTPHPTSSSSASALGNVHTSGLWDQQMDYSLVGSAAGGGGAGAYGEVAGSAWFMPFNLHPPDVGADGEFLVQGFGEAEGVEGMRR
ncbi:hypothetical protein MMC30_005820 [Trapelia coarctata]|nr:hypothetical protein [Trapelia coarctata]